MVEGMDRKRSLGCMDLRLRVVPVQLARPYNHRGGIPKSHDPVGDDGPDSKLRPGGG